MDVHVVVAFLLLLRLCSSRSEPPSTLRFTSVVFRHGDRSATGTFPGDLHKETAWLQGYGQLSQVGMQQEFDLGTYIRSRYTGYLSDTYDRHEVQMQSSPLDRTMMSAQCVLAGLYPPVGTQIFRNQLAWQPIPVHVIDINTVMLLHFDNYSCPIISRHEEQLEKDPVVKNLTIRHQAVIEKISNATNGSISQIGQLSHLYGALFCQKNHQLEWPAWVSDNIMSALKQIRIVYKHQYWCGSLSVIRTTGGMLLRQMLTEMELVARNMVNGNQFKAVLYSGHDTSLLLLMCALDVYNHRLIPYSTSIYVELHHIGMNMTYTKDMAGWYVQVWLRNSTEQEPYLLTLPGCSGNCSLSKLINLTRGSIATNQLSECGFNTLPVFNELWHIVLIAVIVGIAIIFLLLVMTSCCNGTCTRRRMRPRPSSYGKLRATSEVSSRPEEMSMLGSMGGDSDIEG